MILVANVFPICCIKLMRRHKICRKGSLIMFVTKCNIGIHHNILFYIQYQGIYIINMLYLRYLDRFNYLIASKEIKKYPFIISILFHFPVIKSWVHCLLLQVCRTRMQRIINLFITFWSNIFMHNKSVVSFLHFQINFNEFKF